MASGLESKGELSPQPRLFCVLGGVVAGTGYLVCTVRRDATSRLHDIAPGRRGHSSFFRSSCHRKTDKSLSTANGTISRCGQSYYQSLSGSFRPQSLDNQGTEQQQPEEEGYALNAFTRRS